MNFLSKIIHLLFLYFMFTKPFTFPEIIGYWGLDLSVLGGSPLARCPWAPPPHTHTPPHWDQQRGCTCIQCACPVWKKLAVQWLRSVRLKGKGNEETDHNNKWRLLPLQTSLCMSADTLLLPALLLLCCRLSGGWCCRFIYNRIGDGEMPLEGTRHIFSGSDCVEKLWPSQGQEYAALSLCTSGQSVGSLPDKRPIAGWYQSFL